MNVPTIDIVQTGANIKALRKAAGIKVKDVAALLEMAPVLVVPYDAKAAMPAVNRGIPMLSCAPRSKASKAIRAYARSLVKKV